MGRSYLKLLLRPFGKIQENEIFTTLLMFSYSFLAMSAYNIIQPIQRSLFIEKLGANLIPYVQLAAGVLIGVIMTGYAWLASRLPRRLILPITQGVIVILLIAFWFLFERSRIRKRLPQASISLETSWAYSSSANSGRWPTWFSIHARPSDCLDSSEPDLPLEACSGHRYLRFFQVRPELSIC